MPYFDLNEMKNYLGVTEQTDSDYLGLCLGLVEEKLVQRGIVINAANSASTTQVLLSKDVDHCTVYIPYYYEITAVIIKNETDGSTVQVLTSSDYRTLTHVLTPNPVFGLDMVKEYVRYPHYLEITGKKGFSSVLPATLKMAAIELCSKLLSNYKRSKQQLKHNGNEISSTRMGKVGVNYKTDDSGSNTIYTVAQSLIDNNPEFNAIINKYMIPKL